MVVTVDRLLHGGDTSMNIYLFIIITLMLLIFSKIKDSDKYIIFGLPFLYIFTLFSINGNFQKSTAIEIVIVLIPIFFRKLTKKRVLPGRRNLYISLTALLAFVVFIGYWAAGESVMMIGGLGKASGEQGESAGLIIIGILCILATLQLERKKRGDEIKWN